MQSASIIVILQSLTCTSVCSYKVATATFNVRWSHQLLWMQRYLSRFLETVCQANFRNDERQNTYRALGMHGIFFDDICDNTGVITDLTSVKTFRLVNLETSNCKWYLDWSVTRWAGHVVVRPAFCSYLLGGGYVAVWHMSGYVCDRESVKVTWLKIDTGNQWIVA